MIQQATTSSDLLSSLFPDLGQQSAQSLVPELLQGGLSSLLPENSNYPSLPLGIENSISFEQLFSSALQESPTQTMGEQDDLTAYSSVSSQAQKDYADIETVVVYVNEPNSDVNSNNTNQQIGFSTPTPAKGQSLKGIDTTDFTVSTNVVVNESDTTSNSNNTTLLDNSPSKTKHPYHVVGIDDTLPESPQVTKETKVELDEVIKPFTTQRVEDDIATNSYKQYPTQNQTINQVSASIDVTPIKSDNDFLTDNTNINSGIIKEPNVKAVSQNQAIDSVRSASGVTIESQPDSIVQENILISITDKKLVSITDKKQSADIDSSNTSVNTQKRNLQKPIESKTVENSKEIRVMRTDSVALNNITVPNSLKSDSFNALSEIAFVYGNNQSNGQTQVPTIIDAATNTLSLIEPSGKEITNNITPLDLTTVGMQDSSLVLHITDSSNTKANDNLNTDSTKDAQLSSDISKIELEVNKTSANTAYTISLSTALPILASLLPTLDNQTNITAELVGYTLSTEQEIKSLSEQTTPFKIRVSILGNNDNSTQVESIVMPTDSGTIIPKDSSTNDENVITNGSSLNTNIHQSHSLLVHSEEPHQTVNTDSELSNSLLANSISKDSTQPTINPYQNDEVAEVDNSYTFIAPLTQNVIANNAVSTLTSDNSDDKGSQNNRATYELDSSISERQQYQPVLEKKNVTTVSDVIELIEAGNTLGLAVNDIEIVVDNASQLFSDNIKQGLYSSVKTPQENITTTGLPTNQESFVVASPKEDISAKGYSDSATITTTDSQYFKPSSSIIIDTKEVQLDSNSIALSQSSNVVKNINKNNDSNLIEQPIIPVVPNHGKAELTNSISSDKATSNFTKASFENDNISLSLSTQSSALQVNDVSEIESNSRVESESPVSLVSVNYSATSKSTTESGSTKTSPVMVVDVQDIAVQSDTQINSAKGVTLSAKPISKNEVAQSGKNQLEYNTNLIESTDTNSDLVITLPVNNKVENKADIITKAKSKFDTSIPALTTTNQGKPDEVIKEVKQTTGESKKDIKITDKAIINNSYIGTDSLSETLSDVVVKDEIRVIPKYDFTKQSATRNRSDEKEYRSTTSSVPNKALSDSLNLNIDSVDEVDTNNTTTSIDTSAKDVRVLSQNEMVNNDTQKSVSIDSNTNQLDNQLSNFPLTQDDISTNDISADTSRIVTYAQPITDSVSQSVKDVSTQNTTSQIKLQSKDEATVQVGAVLDSTIESIIGETVIIENQKSTVSNLGYTEGSSINPVLNSAIIPLLPSEPESDTNDNDEYIELRDEYVDEDKYENLEQNEIRTPTVISDQLASTESDNTADIKPNSDASVKTSTSGTLSISEDEIKTQLQAISGGVSVAKDTVLRGVSGKTTLAPDITTASIESEASKPSKQENTLVDSTLSSEEMMIATELPDKYKQPEKTDDEIHAQIENNLRPVVRDLRSKSEIFGTMTLFAGNSSNRNNTITTQYAPTHPLEQIELANKAVEVLSPFSRAVRHDISTTLKAQETLTTLNILNTDIQRTPTTLIAQSTNTNLTDISRLTAKETMRANVETEVSKLNDSQTKSFIQSTSGQYAIADSTQHKKTIAQQSELVASEKLLFNDIQFATSEFTQGGERNTSDSDNPRQSQEPSITINQNTTNAGISYSAVESDDIDNSTHTRTTITHPITTPHQVNLNNNTPGEVVVANPKISKSVSPHKSNEKLSESDSYSNDVTRLEQNPMTVTKSTNELNQFVPQKDDTSDSEYVSTLSIDSEDRRSLVFQSLSVKESQSTEKQTVSSNTNFNDVLVSSERRMDSGSPVSSQTQINTTSQQQPTLSVASAIEHGRTQNKVQTESPLQLPQLQVPIGQFVPTASTILRNFTATNGGSVKMILSPEALGTVVVQLTMNERQNKLVMEVESSATKSIIESQLKNLQEQLIQNGVSMDSISVNLRSDSRQGAMDFNQGNQSQQQSAFMSQDNTRREQQQRNGEENKQRLEYLRSLSDEFLGQENPDARHGSNGRNKQHRYSVQDLKTLRGFERIA
jgi:hypothetical protein